MASISGLGSGLDVNSIITQLMQVEARQQSFVKTRQSEAQTELTSWNTLKGQLTTLKAAVQKLASPADWNLLSASSTNESAVGVTAGSGTTAGSISFLVDRLAAAHSVRSTNTVGDLSSIVASGPITLTKSGGSPVSIDIGDGSLSSVVSAINNAGQGVTATAVQVGAGAYRLQVASNASGATSDFTLDLGGGSALGPMTVLQDGEDSRILVGSGPGQYEILNSTNTITNLIPGLTVNLKQTTTSAVTVGVSRDVAGFADRMQAFVDAANVVLAQIKSSTAYDAANKKASPLTGDSTARAVANSIRSLVSQGIGSTGLSAGVFGVQLDKDGRITFDRTKFIDKLNASPADVVSTFAQQSSTTDANVQFVSASAGATPGTYAVNITQAASQATETSAAFPAATAYTMKVRVGTTEATVDVAIGDTAAVVAGNLTSAFAAQGLALNASDSGGSLVIKSNAFGGGATFDVSYDGGGSWATRTGTDVAGTINGVAAVGNGQVLSLSTSDASLPGFTLKITATAAQVTSQGGDFGTVTFNPGVGSSLLKAVEDMTDIVDGSVTGAVTAVQTRIADYTKQIEAWDRRLAVREANLRRQFATLDSLMGQLKTQNSFVTAQISSLGSI